MTRLLITGLTLALLTTGATAVSFTTNQSLWITRTVAQILDQHHFLRQRLDDDISRKHLSFMVNRLDYFHMFFRQTDVDEFGKEFGTSLDDLVLKGKVEPANILFQRYLKRLNEATNHVDKLLKLEFDFTKKERFQPDRHKLGWPKNKKDWDELWRQRIKYELLNGILAGDEDKETRERIWKRYARMARDYNKFDSSEVLQVYLASLGRACDPHSGYMAPIVAQNFDIHNVTMQLTGIGAVLSEDDGYTKIVSVSPGGPAARSKQVFPDDRIVSVGQGEKKPVDVRDMSLNNVVSMIRGKKDTEVVLTMIPAEAVDNSELKVVRLIRDVIKIEGALARAYLIEVPGGKGDAQKLGVIDLPTFYDKCSYDIERLIEKLEAQGATGMILDLRRNGGGLLTEAIALAGLFIKDGAIVQVKDFRGSTMQLDDEDDRVVYDGPLVVMVGKHSASASEIVAAAIQDYGRGIVVGDIHTHGKGTVQTLLPLKNQIPSKVVEDPGKLKFTIQKFYRVAGHSTQKDGVTPDIILPNVMNHLESGEAYLPNVMESDSITPADVKKVHRVTPYLERLRGAVSDLVQTDQDFKYIDEDIEVAKKQKEDKTVSLNESERRTEKKKLKDKIEIRNKERKSRAASGTKVTMLIWKKQNAKEHIEVVTKPTPEPPEKDESEKSAKKDPKSATEKGAGKKPETGKKPAAEKKKPAKKKDIKEPEPTVPPIMRDPHLRVTVSILSDYVNLANETWLAKKK
jgi:carboxyl-terminal processing protease